MSMVGMDLEVIRRYVKEQQQDQIREDQLKLCKEGGE